MIKHLDVNKKDDKRSYNHGGKGQILSDFIIHTDKDFQFIMLRKSMHFPPSYNNWRECFSREK